MATQAKFSVASDECWAKRSVSSRPSSPIVRHGGCGCGSRMTAVCFSPVPVTPLLIRRASTASQFGRILMLKGSPSKEPTSSDSVWRDDSELSSPTAQLFIQIDRYRTMRCILLISVLFGSHVCTAFLSPAGVVQLQKTGQQEHPHTGISTGITGSSRTTTRSSTTTRLYGLLGRFRQKKTVEQVKTIGKGDKLPDGDVEVLKQGGGGAEEGGPPVEYGTESVRDLLGRGKTLLVGECSSSS
jgi:hypothetical protein